MHPFLIYIAKAILISAVLSGYYWLSLRNKKHHSYNRSYLLVSIALSLLLPLVSIDVWEQRAVHASNIIQLLQVVSGNDGHKEMIAGNTALEGWNMVQIGLCLYGVISAILFFRFVFSLYKIFRLTGTGRVEKKKDITLVHTTADNTPFSFLHFIFWNNHIDIHSPEGQQIFLHEMAHVKGRHSYDKLFINMVLVAGWCNPFFWLIKKELGMVHEFIADNIAVQDNDATGFAAMILKAAYPQQPFQLTNNFFHSPIKRRLTMITNNNKTGYTGRMLALPLLFIVFAAFTFKTVNRSSSLYKGNKKIVVIDAGHGGKDFGAEAIGNVYEKDMSLVLAKKVKALNTNDNLEIILTRESDMDQNPRQRAEFINSKNPSLLVSIHMDAAGKDSSDSKSGMSVWVSRDLYDNSLQSKIAASAMIQSFTDNYPLGISPQPMQREQGIFILQESKCPAVLIETGFITNKSDLSFLQSEKGKETIALNVLNGIEKYLSAENK